MGDLRFEELAQVLPGLAARPSPRPGLRALAAAPARVEAVPGLRMRSLSGAATSVRRAHFLVTPPEAWLAGSRPAGWRILCLHLIVSKSLGKQEGIGLKKARSWPLWKAPLQSWLC